jgi:hypothetical protein
MHLPDDIVKHIKEYSMPCRNWRKGSYIHQHYQKNQIDSLLEDLQILIVRKWFSYDRLFHLNLEYKLLEESEKYRNMQSGIGCSFEIRKRGIREDIEETLIHGYNKDPEKRREQLQWRYEMYNS